MVQPAFVDDAGHAATRSTSGSSTGSCTSTESSSLQGDDPLWMQYFAAPERHQYELVYATHRENGFWQRSQDVETRWRFASQRPAGDHESLPLINVDYDLASRA